MCRGTKRIMGDGFIEKVCPTCKGEGLVEDKPKEEAVAEAPKKEEEVKPEPKKRGRPKKI